MLLNGQVLVEDATVPAAAQDLTTTTEAPEETLGASADTDKATGGSDLNDAGANVTADMSSVTPDQQATPTPATQTDTKQAGNNLDGPSQNPPDVVQPNKSTRSNPDRNQKCDHSVRPKTPGKNGKKTPGQGPGKTPQSQQKQKSTAKKSRYMTVGVVMAPPGTAAQTGRPQINADVCGVVRQLFAEHEEAKSVAEMKTDNIILRTGKVLVLAPVREHIYTLK